MSARALFYVQHLKGIGHIVRSARIVAAMVEAGIEVTVAFGGVPVKGFDFAGADVRALAPIRSADGGFAVLLDDQGREIDDAFKARRRDALLALYDELQPDLVVTEMFPLGRRAMRFELEPLLERIAADPRRPRLAASVRDILQTPRDAAKAERQIGLAARHYDLLLVHGDPAFASLEASFPQASAIMDRVRYTGFVGPRLTTAPLADDQRVDVVVSVGGGAVGAEILAAAIAAKPMTAVSDGRWLLLTGPNVAADMALQLTSAAEVGGVTLETFRHNLPETMRAARLSIQMAGYNTVADLMAAGCRAVLIPYVESGETEQSTRAARLAEMQRGVILPIDRLDAASLAAAVDAALALPPPVADVGGPGLDGARESARLLRELLALPRR